MLFVSPVRLIYYGLLRGAKWASRELQPTRQNQHQREGQKMAVAIFGGIALLLAIWNLAGINSTLLQTRLISEGLSAPGVADSVTVIKNPGDIKFTTEYHFDLGGTTYHATQTSPFAHQANQTVTVHYWKSDPNQNELDSPQNTDVTIVFQAIIALSFGLMVPLAIKHWYILATFDNASASSATPTAAAPVAAGKIGRPVEPMPISLVDVELNPLTTDRRG